MSSEPAPRRQRAQSRYKEMRLTYSEEIGGRLSCSVYVKPQNAQWNEHQCLFRWSSHDHPPAESMEQVAARLIAVLQEAFPGVTPS